MPRSIDRRSFLRHSCLFGGSLLSCSIPLDRSGRAAPVRIDAPVIDELTVREITDNQHDIFLRPLEAPGLTVRRMGFPEAPQGKTLESEWGLALHLESRKGEESRRYLLDFGFTPDVYSNNLELMKIDVSQVDALIISHGHYDHVGGLVGFLEAYRLRILAPYHAQASSTCCRIPGYNTASRAGWAATPRPTRITISLPKNSPASRSPISIGTNTLPAFGSAIGG